MSYFSVLFMIFACAYVVSSAAPEVTTKSPSTPSPTTQTPTQSPTTQAPISSSTIVPQHNATFTLNNTNGSVCALVTGIFQLSIQYKNNASATLTNTLYIESTLPGGFKVDGNCGGDTNEQKLAVMFFNGWELDFYFLRDSKEPEDNNYAKNLSLSYIVDADHSFINPLNPGQVNTWSTDKDLFRTKNDKHYVCNKEKTINFADSSATLTVSNLQVQAFHWTSDFVKEVTECLADNESDSNLVPIIVGVCLAALVLVILIAYFIGRWRTSRNPAYQPV